ncbi:hypothetical protein [Streptomyces sp. NPDC006925]|uniref:hypothetical protein n=1 Tax=Streptomyces sp. NPDC006925 TaxID=3364768 RepID=UPI00367E2DC7
MLDDHDRSHRDFLHLNYSHPNTGGLIAIARNRAVSRTPLIPNEASFVAWQKEPETYHVGTVVDEARGAPQSSAENGIRQTLLDADQLARALAADLDRDFSPFWFAVPVARWMAREDGSLDPVTELVPGVWYLAVGQRGHALVAQSEDGRRGLLLDTSGIQRADIGGGVKYSLADVAEFDADQLARALAADPDRDFSPFWFAVPVARWIAREDGSLDPVTELVPGVWYLAVGRRGHALVAQSEDGRRGLLLDTSGIQRG